MKPRLLLTAALLATATDLTAAQLVEVVGGQTATVKVSAKELTRIAMADGGRIERVWGMDEHMQVQPDADGGQVFLRPLPGTAKAFSFFVRDDAGETYTLLALPVDMPSDTVLLRSRSRSAAGTQSVTPAGASDRTAPRVERIKSLVRAMATGVVAEGYLPDYRSEAVERRPEAKVLRTARFQGELVGEIYAFTNTSRATLQLAERDFLRVGADVAAVGIEQRTLAPKQTTRVYVVRTSSSGGHDGE